MPPKLVRRADGVLDAEDLVDLVRCDARLDGLEGLQRQVLEPAAAPLRLGDDPPGDVVGVAERHAERAHEPVGEIGRGREAGPGDGRHPLRHGLEVLDHAGHGGEHDLERVGGVEELLLVLLHVLANR